MQQTRQGYIYALTSKTTGKVHVTRLRANDRRCGYNMSAGDDGGRNSLSPEVRRREPSDQKLAEKYGVSRKLVWRMRHDVRGCTPHSEAA